MCKILNNNLFYIYIILLKWKKNDDKRQDTYLQKGPYMIDAWDSELKFLNNDRIKIKLKFGIYLKLNICMR